MLGIDESTIDCGPKNRDNLDSRWPHVNNDPDSEEYINFGWGNFGALQDDIPRTKVMSGEPLKTASASETIDLLD